MPSPSPVTLDTIYALGFAVFALAALLIVVRAILRAGSRPQTAAPLEREHAAEEPRCLACSEPATDPSPAVARGRGSQLRDLLTLPPRYRRVVPSEDAPLVYCRSHAHLADSKTTEFLAEQHAALTRAYSQVAHRAAMFEQEELPRLMRESITENQKKEARRGASSVVPLRRASTDDH